MKQLWRLLAQTWGNRFLENYGNAPNEAWSAALANLSAQQCKHALGQLIKSGTPHPPTLPEFMVEARKYRPAFKSRPEELTNPVSPEKAQENIRRLREAMKDLH